MRTKSNQFAGILRRAVRVLLPTLLRVYRVVVVKSYRPKATSKMFTSNLHVEHRVFVWSEWTTSTSVILCNFRIRFAELFVMLVVLLLPTKFKLVLGASVHITGHLKHKMLCPI